MKILLGSNSPRRKSILESMNLTFTTLSNNFDEDLIKFKTSPGEYVEELATAKAKSLAPMTSDESYLICGDTIVYYKEKIYPKPKDLDEAYDYLKHLSGNTHTVYSGVCLSHKNRSYSSFEETKVTFRDLTEKMISRYFNLIDPLDKAGGYAIQGAGSLIVSKIDGCFYNVMGMPINALFEVFNKAGLDLWELIESPKQ